jgi:DNA-binding NtrC family response regulator
LVQQFSARQLEKISEGNWPGNIRELRNHIRRLCVFGGDDGESTVVKSAMALPAAEDSVAPLKDYIDRVEKEYIVSVLSKCGGKVSLAHSILGLSRKGLYDKINKHCIELDALC